MAIMDTFKTKHICYGGQHFCSQSQLQSKPQVLKQDRPKNPHPPLVLQACTSEQPEEPLTGSDHQIWALVDHRKSRCYGKAHPAACSQVVSRNFTSCGSVKPRYKQGVTISNNYFRIPIRFMASRGQKYKIVLLSQWSFTVTIQ